MISSRQSKNKRGCYERKSCFISQGSLTSPQQQNQSGLQAEYLAQPSRNSVFKHFRSYPKVSTSAQQDDGRSSGCISFTKTLTKCAKCVQSGKNTSPTMQAIQSLILPQTMSPDDSCASRIHKDILYRLSALLSFVFLDVYTLLPSFHLSSLSCWLCYSCLSGGTYCTSMQRAGGVVVLLGGYLLSSRTFSCWRVGTCCEGSWLRLLKSVLRHGDVLAEGFFGLHFRVISIPFLGTHFPHLIQSQ